MCSRRLQPSASEGVSSMQDAGRVSGDTGSGVSSVQGYGGVASETAGERYDRQVEAIAGVLRSWGLQNDLNSATLRKLARECLDAAEAGF